MLNVTARLAVDIRYLPPGLEFTNTLQKSHNSQTIDDLLLSSEDGEVLVKRAVRYMMEFLVTHFKDLASMAKLVPKEECPHPVQKSTVLPMKILVKDEKYTDDTINILRQLVTDATLSGDAQGDITKLCSYLIDNKASKEDLSRTSILTFDDPETKGLERVAKGWIEEYLSGSVQFEEDESAEVTMDEDDLYYEL